MSWGWAGWRSPWFWLLALALVIASGLTDLPGPGPSDTLGGAPPTRLEQATPRGLTVAVLRHLGDAAEVASVRGADEGSAIAAWIGLDDANDTSIYVSAMSPGLHWPAGCGLDAGYTVVLCERRPDGSLVEVARGPERSARGHMPLLIGHASRPDGSHLLVEIFATNETDLPEELAADIVSDRLVGWQTTTANNLFGGRLSSFGALRTRTELARANR